MTNSMAAELPSAGDDLLDPELRPIVEAQRARMLSPPSLESVTPAEMRLRAAAEFAEWNADPPAIDEVRDFAAAGVPVRLYVPRPSGESGLLIYAHGGGWVIGDLDLEDAALRRLALRSGVRVLSVDYRLAPEHPFPAALEDITAVVRWAASGPGEIPIDATRIALGGASAGANVALGTALRLRDSGGAAVRFLLLLYGAYSGGLESESYRLFGDGRFGLPRAAMDWFWRTYAGGAASNEQGYAVPLQADLRGLPPVYVNYAELDILRDDSAMLVNRLREAGVAVDDRAYAGAVHGFTQYAKSCALARRALDEAADALAAALA